MGKVNAQFTTTLQPLSHSEGYRQVDSTLLNTRWSLRGAAHKPKEKTSLAYIFLSLFVLIYWARPNHWIPGAGGISFAKISGALAIASFFLWLLLERRGALSLPREMIYLLLLYLQLCIAIPFALWPGGSFQLVIIEYSKIVMITLVVMMTVSSFARLNKLIFIQTATVILMAALAASGHGNIVNSAYGQRLGGMFGGTYENPNDFALDLALVFPFAFAFLLATRNYVWKTFWFLSMGLLIYVVMATYSRGGLLALLAGVAVVMWEFAVKGKRPRWILLFCLCVVAFVISSGHAGYAHRLATIFSPDSDVSGSAQDRRVLFDRAVTLTLDHPLVGVGPGNFTVVSGASGLNDWHDPHNTYLEFSSEAGIPALVLFLVILGLAFSSVRKAKKLAVGDAKLTLVAGALRASLVSLIVGAFFGDVAFHFFPYFLIGFACALAHIAQTAASSEQSLPQNHVTGNDSKVKIPQGSQRWLGLGHRTSPS